MKTIVAPLLVTSLLAYGTPAQASAFRAPGLRLLAAPEAAATPAPAAAPAGETESFDALIAQATEKFKDKDYAGSVALFERAYAVQPEPAILFNIGRIYEEAQNAEAAIGYYEKFIADESVELKDREKAVQRLQVLRTIVEIREKEKAKAQPPAPKPQPETQPRPADPQPKPTTDKPQQNRFLKPAGFALIGTGAALLIGGAVSGGLARRQYGAFTSAETLQQSEDAQQRGRQLAITADALFITGGIVAAVGVVLLVVPSVRKSRAAKAAAALSPQVSPTQVGLGYTHRF
jgi:tetratricopeptide (TPR) repeat protein